MIKSNNMASTVFHAENCLCDIASAINKDGSKEQKKSLERAMTALEELYFLLQEEE